MKLRNSSLKAMGPFLEEVFQEHHRPEKLSSDPLEFVYRLSDPLAQEAVAVVAAQLAYGNVIQIRRSVEELLGRILRSPSGSFPKWIDSLSDSEGMGRAEKDLAGFVHRFHTAKDLLLLLQLVNRSWQHHGSVGALFLEGLPSAEGDITQALNIFLGTWRRWAIEMNPEVARSRSFSHFLSAPEQGSCCKRWCMFLRWMGRRDCVDPGLWTAGSPLSRTFREGRALHARQLILPLDTHTGRISRYLGLTSRKNLGWKAAIEVTRALREVDPEDPVRFDFALARLGILDLCQKRFRVEICRKCQLLPVCVFAKSEIHRVQRTRV